MPTESHGLRPVGDYGGAEALHILRKARGTGPLSDVIMHAKAIANLGSSVDAGLVIRCEGDHLRGSNSAERECAVSRIPGRERTPCKAVG